MNRRTFLKRALGSLPAAMLPSCFASGLQSMSSDREVRVTLDSARTLAVIPPDFIGLGYEISSIARPGLLSAQSSVYGQLVRTLGAHGVIRVGGNTSDYSSYSPSGQPLSSPEGKAGSVVNDAVLRDLGSFLDATGWQLVWGLNLGNGTLENAIEEAKAVRAASRENLLAFEIGNEPDLFPRHQGHRRTGYGYDDYLREYRAYRDALRKAIPKIAFAGPDVADATDWVTRFAVDEGKDIKLLTHHYYREGQNPTSSIDRLLYTDPKLAPILEKLRTASESSGVPYRICEANSFSGGGKPGVSDTTAAALWALDFMFVLASAGCAGVNMETGVNQRGFVSSYSPIQDNGKGVNSAGVPYNGMLAFATACAGCDQLLPLEEDNLPESLTAHSFAAGGKLRSVVIVNTDAANDAHVSVAGLGMKHASVLRLLAPAAESTTGVTFADAAVDESGRWKPKSKEKLSDGTVTIPRMGAAVLRATALTQI